MVGTNCSSRSHRGYGRDRGFGYAERAAASPRAPPATCISLSRSPTERRCEHASLRVLLRDLSARSDNDHDDQRPRQGQRALSRLSGAETTPTARELFLENLAQVLIAARDRSGWGSFCRFLPLHRPPKQSGV